ncbi:hypothetical protein D3C72_1880540 [compost metagenome]
MERVQLRQQIHALLQVSHIDADCLAVQIRGFDIRLDIARAGRTHIAAVCLQRRQRGVKSKTMFAGRQLGQVNRTGQYIAERRFKEFSILKDERHGVRPQAIVGQCIHIPADVVHAP